MTSRCRASIGTGCRRISGQGENHNVTALAVEWLESIQRELQDARCVEAASRASLAPGFLALSFLRTDEYGISRILADLLDPYGTHGQGSAFLKAFLARYWPEVQLDADRAVVVLESATTRIANHRRRLDIRVRVPGAGVLGIENKVHDAVDQDNQVADYLKDLSSERVPYRLIYLTATEGQMPLPSSIDERARAGVLDGGTLSCLGFPALREWLRECIGLSKSGRVRAFLDEIILFIESELMGITNMTLNNLIVEAATRNTDDLRAAMQVVVAADDIRKRVFDRFKHALKTWIERPGPHVLAGWTADVSEDLLSTSKGIIVKPHFASRYAFRLVFDSPGGRQANIGIAALNPQGEEDCEAVHESLRAVLGNGQCAEPRWPWWTGFKPGNWGSDPDAMAAMLDDGDHGLVERVAARFEDMCQDLTDSGQLTLLV